MGHNFCLGLMGVYGWGWVHKFIIHCHTAHQKYQDLAFTQKGGNLVIIEG